MQHTMQQALAALRLLRAQPGLWQHADSQVAAVHRKFNAWLGAVTSPWALYRVASQAGGAAEWAGASLISGALASRSLASSAPTATLPAITSTPLSSAEQLLPQPFGRGDPAGPSMAAPPLTPPAHPRGSSVPYPFPIQPYRDREAIIYSMSGAPRGVLTLPGDVCNVPVRVDVLFRVVRWLRSVWQQGTHKTKRRGEVRGGGRKPRPQKGTGMSRQGSIRSPIWVGGGKAHGPVPRSHAHKLPLSIQLLGYKCALSAKANEGRLVVVDSLVPPLALVDGRLQVKTKSTLAALRALLARVPHASALLVDCGPDSLDGGEALRRGARNLPWVCIMPWQQVTVYHLLKYNALVITQPALQAMVARLGLPIDTDPAVRRQRAWAGAQRQSYGAALAALKAADAAVQNAAQLAQSVDSAAAAATSASA